MHTTRRSMLGFLGIGTAAFAGRAFTGCASNARPSNAGNDASGDAPDGGYHAGFDASGYSQDAKYDYPDGAYNQPHSDAGESCAPTRPDAQGPFFAPGAPSRTALATASEPGAALSILGRVLQEDCVTPIEGALLDVWQADAAGNYHDAGTDYRLRGQMLTDAAGEYGMTTIKPGAYQTSPGAWRPAHLHFTVSKPGFLPVTTQLYFAGDPFLPPNDSCTGCGSDDEDRVIALTEAQGVLVGEFRIVLRRRT